MGNWDPKLYGRFEAERSRPAVELLARAGLREPFRVVDIGCGAGGSTQIVAERFPAAEILGVDSSVEMLAAARKRLPALRFEQGDAVKWRDPSRDLVFANAVLHWIPNHVALMANWADDLPDGGVLAAQMPDNEDEPTHALMREIAATTPFRQKLANAGAGRAHIGAFAEYDEALAPYCAAVDIWRTTYVHRLAGPEEIVAWVQGAGLRPFLAPLTTAEREHFLALYGEAIARAYPRRAWGGVLLAFPRLFVVAARRKRR